MTTHIQKPLPSSQSTDIKVHKNFLLASRKRAQVTERWALIHIFKLLKKSHIRGKMSHHFYGYLFFVAAGFYTGRPYLHLRLEGVAKILVFCVFFVC